MLEVNPLAGLTPGHSDLPIMAQLKGMEYRALIGEILRCATARLAADAERAAAA
jgi:D-alanine-D-alanine ligase